MRSDKNTGEGEAPIRVIVVEDEPLVRMAVVESMRDRGFTVLEANDAGEAQTLMDEPDDIDAVFSDVQMPGPMDGLQLARWLNHHHPEVAVLLTSGRIQPSEIEGVPAASAIVPKPYDNAAVTDEIETLVSHKRHD